MSVVISYRASDRAFAQEVYHRLKARKIAVWMDLDMRGGANFREVIVEKIRSCDRFIPVLSSAYLESDYCRLECYIARALGKKLVPIMIDDCCAAVERYEETKALLEISTLDFFRGDRVGLPLTKEGFFERLIDGVERDYEPPTPLIYVSYRFQDSVIATRLAQSLVAKGATAWVASLHSPVGSRWREMAARAMMNACAHLVVLGENLSENNVLRTELILSEALGVRPFTALVPQCSNPEAIARLGDNLRNKDLFHRLYRLHHFHLTESEDPAPADLVAALKERIAGARRLPFWSLLVRK